MTSQTPILDVSHMSIAFGGLRALEDVSVQVNENEFVGLIGPNGAGKTTFFNSITGYIRPSEGKILFNGENLVRKPPSKIANYGISRTFQNIRLFPKMTVLDNVSIPMHSTPKYSVWAAMLGLPSVKRVQIDTEKRALEFLSIMGLVEHKDRQAGTLPYGLQRRLEIARALAASPKLLLLDEPAAGMNNDECNELIELLRGIYKTFNLTVVMIEHHIDIVMKLCSRIYVLNLGKVLAEGTPKQIQTDPQVIKAYLGERRRKA
ncbi:ABC transporter ATP-binding protein [Cloacibacillus porcorum]|jgi:branched-chain amino acid transport system ATP-binding protein|uniref:High-affinity branched-chain amino acid ABC transporter ATP-binding protein LivG n=1 Tax=Cloacibacillus porcorum TaxID=1197717 RepID=A0A1B2I7Z0_9BACT|nr:ABC transporter ATP-binding protein [Cloacibacillus porcorum]ANZ46098.1 high-affinity branched-chain amino acid ABC transporter ATP-binding protein LivG [Cloacibacillus porcorum]MCC8183689.1 ABC transporter ATP-binding protein [Cloacibacillus porcorum]MCI5866083.1 ABC transporter ATP-binding protein [Cloacibacillus porcorum]MDD7650022.1 ABC transporter ATP-binding protein [Cloacibacillus porcorum]MDY4094215.1 ABC transporter ATP-binding protein [Cloacibacillus porcorum]